MYIGIDSPLSNNGDNKCRESDNKLKEEIKLVNKTLQKLDELNLNSVMSPMGRRMIYLTIRGVLLSRTIHIEYPSVKIVEVHPRASLFLHFHTLIAQDIKNYKDPNGNHARENIVNCLNDNGMLINTNQTYTDHEIDSMVAAYSAFCWRNKKSKFLFNADDPFLPFDYCC